MITSHIDPDRLRRCYATVREALLAERTPQGHWVGELSTSALSTATAVMALLQVQSPTRNQVSPKNPGFCSETLDALITGGLRWLLDHQNENGGWGDTVKSFSNISTTMLCHAVLVAEQKSEVGVQRSLNSQLSTLNSSIERAQRYIDRAGGVPALVARYGQDKTFSVPILTHCALAGLVDWQEITPLPFELACLPARFYKTVRLPVVSYALPALIAIGQVRHHFAPTRNPITRILRNCAVKRTLKVLERIQPTNGGFLEATPLTSFVTMSLAAKGLVDHPVVQRGVEFIVNSVREDGSWPIDTNLATWVTTLSVNALGDDLPEDSRLPILNWLLDQQYKEVHPYTNADPGGWAWTDLPGGVPDADDTPGAILAILELSRELRVESREVGGQRSEVRDQESDVCEDATESPAIAMAGSARSDATQPTIGPPRSQARAWERTRHEAPLRPRDGHRSYEVRTAISSGINWLIGLQNRDGGFPTFCRGWGKLPFDRSSADITAHGIRVIITLIRREERGIDPWGCTDLPPSLWRAESSCSTAFRHLERTQRPDGSWLPLWFGNQHAPDDINPTYGTAKVLAAYRDCDLLDEAAAQNGLAWLRSNHNDDGGWGAGLGTPSSVEETSLAVEALLDDPLASEHIARGLSWLMDRVEAMEQPATSTIAEQAPIGFYFAKLWYFERLYPLVFAVSCLRRAVRKVDSEPRTPQMEPSD